jgi:hypothetical protein
MVKLASRVSTLRRKNGREKIYQPANGSGEDRV